MEAHTDQTATNVPKVLDDTFNDYSSDSDTDQIPTEPLQIVSKKACVECKVVSNLKFTITPDKFVNFGIGRHRGRRPRAPVPNFVSWICAICRRGQDTILTKADIEVNTKLILSFSQKLSQVQERNQEHMHHNLPSDGDGRPPVSVTPEVCNDHENNTQQHEDVREGMPPVPDVKS
ncbi:hypothetical protein JTB14_027182 [Gonioctena quinquepunctata]|nr:hypothetical protein JTB14_027182 [Gonioctena quinquepunctata]